MGKEETGRTGMTQDATEILYHFVNDEILDVNAVWSHALSIMRYAEALLRMR